MLVWAGRGRGSLGGGWRGGSEQGRRGRGVAARQARETGETGRGWDVGWRQAELRNNLAGFGFARASRLLAATTRRIGR